MDENEQREMQRREAASEAAAGWTWPGSADLRTQATGRDCSTRQARPPQPLIEEALLPFSSADA